MSQIGKKPQASGGSVAVLVTCSLPSDLIFVCHRFMFNLARTEEAIRQTGKML